MFDFVSDGSRLMCPSLTIYANDWNYPIYNLAFVKLLSGRFNSGLCLILGLGLIYCDCNKLKYDAFS